MTTPLGLVRICAFLRKAKKATVVEIAQACFVSEKHVRRAMLSFREIGLAHKAEHIRRTGMGGTQIIVWAYGCAPDAPKLPREPSTVVRRRRVDRLRTTYGNRVATKILQCRKDGGADKIVINGETIYQRGKTRGARN